MPARSNGRVARKPRGVLATIGLAVLLVGCGSATPPIRNGSPGPIRSGSPGAGSAGSSSSSAVGGHRSLPTVALHPTTYAGDSPCVSVATDGPVSATPPACGALWKLVQATIVPGQNLMQSSPIPRVVSVSDQVDPSSAAEWATAFVRTDAFQLWGTANASPVMVAALDAPERPGGALEDAMQRGGQISVPSCSYPSGLTAVPLDDPEVAAVRSAGWSNPSRTALLATFPPCSGYVVRFPNGGVYIAESTATSITIVISGTVGQRPLFGAVWVIDGEASCGSMPALSSVCALAGG